MCTASDTLEIKETGEKRYALHKIIVVNAVRRIN